jgi:hypothetical protein
MKEATNRSRFRTLVSCVLLASTAVGAAVPEIRGGTFAGLVNVAGLAYGTRYVGAEAFGVAVLADNIYGGGGGGSYLRTGGKRYVRVSTGWMHLRHRRTYASAAFGFPVGDTVHIEIGAWHAIPMITAVRRF